MFLLFLYYAFFCNLQNPLQRYCYFLTCAIPIFRDFVFFLVSSHTIRLPLAYHSVTTRSPLSTSRQGDSALQVPLPTRPWVITWLCHKQRTNGACNVRLRTHNAAPLHATLGMPSRKQLSIVSPLPARIVGERTCCLCCYNSLSPLRSWRCASAKVVDNTFSFY